MTVDEVYELTKYVNENGERGLHSWVNKTVREMGCTKNPNWFEDIQDDILLGMDELEEQGKPEGVIDTLTRILEVLRVRTH